MHIDRVADTACTWTTIHGRTALWFAPNLSRGVSSKQHNPVASSSTCEVSGTKARNPPEARTIHGSLWPIQTSKRSVRACAYVAGRRRGHQRSQPRPPSSESSCRPPDTLVCPPVHHTQSAGNLSQSLNSSLSNSPPWTSFHPKPMNLLKALPSVQIQ